MNTSLPSACDPHEPEPPRRHRWLAGLACFALAAGVAAVFFLFNPESSAFFPRCHFHQFTGLHCPGCGGQRALHQLLHGEFAAALRHNALLFLLLPLAGAWLLRALVQRVTGRLLPLPFQRSAWVWALAGAALVFGVVRNLPFGPCRLLAP